MSRYRTYITRSICLYLDECFCDTNVKEHLLTIPSYPFIPLGTRERLGPESERNRDPKEAWYITISRTKRSESRSDKRDM
jgi:hypothetical protein